MHKIEDLAKRFVLLRLTNMRGVDLDRFDFDYDLTWAAFFLGAEGKVLGRYGGRDAESADARLSIAGFRFAMSAALAAHGKTEVTPVKEPSRVVRSADQYPAARRLKETACIHCHHVYDFRREELQAAGKWRLDELWVYPLPENVGFALDVDVGNRIRRVQADSAAAGSGLKEGDALLRINDMPIASLADAQYALHRVGATGKLPLVFQRGERALTAQIELPAGWRKTDISWRWSLRGVEPVPPVRGDDLDTDEKRALGLAADMLAFRQANFVSVAARQAGIQQNDVILGVDGKQLKLSARQFGAYLRLNYRVGDTVTFNVLRVGRKIEVSLKLPARPPF